MEDKSYHYRIQSSLVKALTYDDVGMIPAYSDIESRSECNISTQLTKTISLKLPIIASPMDTICGKEMAEEMNRLGGLGIVHRFNSIEEQINELPKNGLKAAAVGVTGDWWERTVELVNNRIDLILLDVAHGHHVNVKRALEQLKSEFPTLQVMAGNVCTFQGTKDLIEWGTDVVRVGIGGGSACETRIRSAVGVPQITAILSSVNAAHRTNTPIVADGGIRYPGDVAKALGIGASTVMLGSLIAGTRETPGLIQKIGEWPNEQLYKLYRGSASLSQKVASGQAEKNVEGNSRTIPYKGKVERIISDINDGLRSGMSYVGARTLEEFRKNAEFVEVTNAGQREARPHILEM